MAADSAPVVDLVILRSRQLATLIFLAHALALAAAAYAPLSPVLLAAAGATVLTSFIVQFRRHAALIGTQAVRRLVWSQDGHWDATDGEGVTHRCDLLPEPTPGPPLTILRLRDSAGTTRVVLLFEDSADREQLRMLRARLRLA